MVTIIDKLLHLISSNDLIESTPFDRLDDFIRKEANDGRSVYSAIFLTH